MYKNMLKLIILKEKLLLFVVIFMLASFVFAQEINVFDVARNGTVEDMMSIMEKDKSIIDSVDVNGFTPLILASYRNNEPVVKFLVDKIKKINHLSSSGTALSAASYKGLTPIVKILLEYKANPNIADSTGATPLIYATFSEQIEIINLLLNKGAEKRKKDNKGNSALEYALFSNNNDLINLLK